MLGIEKTISFCLTFFRLCDRIICDRNIMYARWYSYYFIGSLVRDCLFCIKSKTYVEMNGKRFGAKASVCIVSYVAHNGKAGFALIFFPYSTNGMVFPHFRPLALYVFKQARRLEIAFNMQKHFQYKRIKPHVKNADTSRCACVWVYE